ncbi:MAG TPA: hypothetical protein VIN08_04000, partial [Ohtaekwangia sp.]
RYINIFLWLPVANIFGSIIAKIQENMLRIDLAQIDRYGDTFFSAADTGYLIFLIIGIIGYFTVPSVANYIVHAGGANMLLHKTSSVLSNASTAAVSLTTTGAKSVLGVFTSSSSQKTSGNGARHSDEGGFMHDKLSGK